jgi:ABC-type antimicrobial peptide transport system permease subunit
VQVLRHGHLWRFSVIPFIGKTEWRPFVVLLLAGFAGFGLILALLGIYGVISYSVSQRKHEIGIRMALGADRRDVVRMVMREAGVLLIAGLAVGTVSALAAAQSARSLLFGLTPYDPLTLVTAAAALAAVNDWYGWYCARVVGRTSVPTLARTARCF